MLFRSSISLFINLFDFKNIYIENTVWLAPKINKEILCVWHLSYLLIGTQVKNSKTLGFICYRMIVPITINRFVWVLF